MTRLPKKYFKSISDYVKTYYTAYGAQRAQKLYDAVKTVTKDFTRTDPVYVRIGEDGEPEIHYTATKANYSFSFQNMNFGDASFYFHNGKIVTNMVSMMRGVTAKRIIIDSTASATELSSLFRDVNGKDLSGTLIDSSSANDIALICDEMINVVLPPRFANTSHCASATQLFGWCASLQYIPEMNLSGAKSLIYAFDGCTSVTEFHAKGMQVSFSISSTALKHDAILEVFNNLGTVDATAGITLTLGSAKLALMSDEEKAIATGKGWVLA